MDYLSRLERKAEKSRVTRDDEEMPHYIDSYYDDLEEPPTASERLNRISPSDARWLAQLVRQNLDTEHERIGAEMEKELAVSLLLFLCVPKLNLWDRTLARRGTYGISKSSSFETHGQKGGPQIGWLNLPFGMR